MIANMRKLLILIDSLRTVYRSEDSLILAKKDKDRVRMFMYMNVTLLFSISWSGYVFNH